MRTRVSALLPLLLSLVLVACSNGDSTAKKDAAASDADGGGQGSTPDETGDVDAAAGSTGDADGSSAASGDADGGDTTTPPCGGSCDDGVDCTADSCVNNVCVHALDASLCSGGASCDPQKGCQLGAACGKAADCADSDGCTVNERCDVASARCLWDPLDHDGDRQAPTSCGGTDCDDSNGQIAPNALETCDGVDNDCDGTVDDGATCAGGATCSAGACVCPAGEKRCGTECVDFTKDAQHCGDCRTSCGSGGACVDGACTCPAPSMECGRTCEDLTISTAHCGSCGTACALPAPGRQAETCQAATCVACGREGQACCNPYGCGSGLSCTGELTDPGATCACPSSSTKCGTACVDLATDERNCGACGTACTAGQTCQASAAGAACVACGARGEPCCDLSALGIPGAGLCGRGLSCGAGSLCVGATGPAPQPGAP